MKSPCVWKYSDDEMDYYETGCGESFIVLEGTPTENRMRFCAYCGRPLIVQLTERETARLLAWDDEKP